MATVQFDWFAQAFATEQGGPAGGDAYQWDYLSDTINVMLLTSAAAPNLDTWKNKGDVTNEVSGTGYVARGTALGTKTLTVTAANSWGTSRANTTAYVAGDVVRPASANGFLYRCVVAGTSAGSPPTFSTTIGRETADNTVVWSTLGAAIAVWDAADPSWAGASFTARYAVVYKDTSVDATSPLIALGTFSADVTASGGTFLITFPNQLPGWAYKARA